MIFSIVFIFSFLVIPTFAMEPVADSIDNYRVVCDPRNFKAATGGKSTKPQGIPLYAQSECLLIGEKFLALPNIDGEEYPWRYMVTMNCKKGNTDDLMLMVTKFATQLLPPAQRHRLAILIGINEKLRSSADIDVSFDWRDLKAKRKELEKLGIPILFVYTPWSTYRDGPSEETPVNIIRNIRLLFDGLNERQSDALRKKIKEQDDKHGFPFGAMRTHLLKNEFTHDFVEQFSRGKPVYYHIQDSDFKNLKTVPQFYAFGSPTEPTIVNADEKYLYAKYDSLISAMERQNSVYPIIVGGAHVYDPAEELDGVGISAKQWTRFASEIGNMINTF